MEFIPHGRFWGYPATSAGTSRMISIRETCVAVRKQLLEALPETQDGESLYMRIRAYLESGGGTTEKTGA